VSSGPVIYDPYHFLAARTPDCSSPVGRTGFFEKIGFVLFLIAMGSYVAQGLVAWMAFPIRPILRMPPQVGLVGLSFGFVLLGAPGRVFKALRQWPIFFAVPPLIIFIAQDAVWPVDAPYLRALQVFTGMLVFINAYVLCSHEIHIKRLLQVVFLISIASAVFAMFEWATGRYMNWEIWSRAGQLATYDRVTGHPAGLEASPVPFSYSLVTPAAMALLFAFSKQKLYGNPGRLFSLIAGVVCGIGLLASASRSGILGVGMGVGISWLLLLRPRWRRKSVFIVAAIVAIVIGVFVGERIASYVMKAGMIRDVRLYRTYATYVPIIVAHPLGLAEGLEPRERFQGALERAEQRLGIRVEEEIARPALSIAPHNMFLTVGWTTGWIGLGSLVAIYFYCLTRSFRSARSTGLPPPIRLLQVALFAGIVALLIHGTFHNASILLGEMRNWFYFGLLCVLPTAAAGYRSGALQQPMPHPAYRQ